VIIHDRAALVTQTIFQVLGLIGTLAEIGAAHAWGKPRFVAFANETLADQFYFIRQLASAAVVAPSVVEA
jgi:hypothetical protein